MSTFQFHGLCPATHTPFHADGSLNLAVVEQQAAHLLARKIDRVFIGGTTGESVSLQLAERLALHENLDLPGGVLELGEARLAHDAS